MATLKLRIEKLRFVSYQGTKPEVFHPTYASGNGWSCRIYPDGRIVAKTSKQENGRYSEMTFKVTSRGVATLTKLENGMRSELRHHRIYRYPIDGTLWLKNGMESERTSAYFDYSKK